MNAFGEPERRAERDARACTRATPTRSSRRKIARYLGVELGSSEVFEFANENIFVRILDNVREKDVFLIQPTCRPVQKSIMELLIMIDAFKRASAGRITAVVPYYAYGRSDKKDQPRVPITARLIADMISVAGADRLLTMDLHQGQIQGFFNIPVDELTAVHLLSNYFVQKQLENPVVVTDLGLRQARAHVRGAASARRWPSSRSGARPTTTAPRCSTSSARCAASAPIIVDDEVDTAGTLIEIRRALEREGVVEMYACATHGVLSGPAVERIRELRPDRGRRHRHHPAAARARSCATCRSSASRRSSARPSARIHRGESVGALFSSEIQLVQEMLLWGEQDEDGDRQTRRPTAVARADRSVVGAGQDASATMSQEPARQRRSLT